MTSGPRSLVTTTFGRCCLLKWETKDVRRLSEELKDFVDSGRGGMFKN